MTDRQDRYDDEHATQGDRIAAAREAAGLSQAELSRRLGVRLATVRSWEDDQSDPRANRMQMLAGMLGVSLVWLLSGQGQGPELRRDDGPADLRAAQAALRAIAAEQARLAERVAQVERRLRQAAAAAR
jgi:ribosome-binding protein aMBF1 (putative translation factor)